VLKIECLPKSAKRAAILFDPVDCLKNIEGSREMRRRNIIIVAASVILVVVVGLLIKDYFTVDRCLDSGGRWSHDEGRCIGFR
jgi:hypothetical protein